MKRRIVLIAGAAVMAAGAIALLLGLSSSRTPPSLPVKAAEGVPASPPPASPFTATYPRVVPVRVIVPSLGINATVIPEGCTGPASDCVLDTPPLTGPQSDDAGWWDGGWAPGQAGAVGAVEKTGPAVIVGHINSAAMGNLVFSNLSSVKVGAMIETEPGNLWFRVTGTQEAGKDAFPTQAVYGATPVPSLRLITCGGAFDSATGHYLMNFIVYAVQSTG